MRFSAVLTCAALSLLAAPAIAGDKKPVDPNKKVCRSEETTGSIMPPKRICRTRDEWAAIDQANAQQNEQYRNARESGARLH